MFDRVGFVNQEEIEYLMVLTQPSIHMGKIKLDSYLMSYTKVNFRCVINLKGNSQTIKCLDKKMHFLFDFFDF
jgi:hypothetical protein